MQLIWNCFSFFFVVFINGCGLHGVITVLEGKGNQGNFYAFPACFIFFHMKCGIINISAGGMLVKRVIQFCDSPTSKPG